MKPTADRFFEQADRALDLVQLQGALHRTTGRFVTARLNAVGERHDWEDLRTRARAARNEALTHLDRYLVELERNVVRNGGSVFWARTAEEACRYIQAIATRRGVRLAVKSKSMATEEIGLNHALEAIGVVPVETDLGEYIIQLADETPSHFLAPAIHWTKERVGFLFERVLGVPRTADPGELTAIARKALRDRFLAATMGISGANFAVAETGSIVILENEGNARLATSLPPVHVAVMGIEKVIPRFHDLDPLLNVLPRSATGQRLSTYVSILNGSRRPDERDGPEEFHLVLLDNGRTRLLADPEARESLLCIRCSACLAVCPVYRRAGGHAYGWVYQGPIGAVLTPGLLGVGQAPILPSASSLCGACRDACPVRIDIPRMLLHLRRRVVEDVPGSGWARLGLKIAAWVMASPSRFRAAGRFAYWAQRLAGGGEWIAPGPLGGWARWRTLPRLARRPLRDLVRDR
jgi:L-lactate dehydrogenase complex protein LldF